MKKTEKDFYGPLMLGLSAFVIALLALLRGKGFFG